MNLLLIPRFRRRDEGEEGRRHRPLWEHQEDPVGAADFSVGMRPRSILLKRRVLDNLARLYEQDADLDRIGQYVKLWWRGVPAGQDLASIL